MSDEYAPMTIEQRLDRIVHDREFVRAMEAHGNRIERRVREECDRKWVREIGSALRRVDPGYEPADGAPHEAVACGIRRVLQRVEARVRAEYENSGSPMSVDRAKGLVKAVLFGGPDPGASLLDLVHAARIVAGNKEPGGEPGTTRLHVYPDDRLIAAAYVAWNHRPGQTTGSFVVGRDVRVVVRSEKEVRDGMESES
jgi:hypothetical protein